MISRSQVPWHIAKGQLVIRLRATPNARQNRIEDVTETGEGLALRARINAPPLEGRANVALENLVATWLGVPKCAVTLVGGQKSRIKSVAISGDLKALEQRVSEAITQLKKSNF